MNEVKTGAEGGVGNQTIGQPFNLQLPVTPSPTAINPQVVDDFMFIGGGGGGSASPSTTPGFLWDVNTPTLLNSDGTTESGNIIVIDCNINSIVQHSKPKPNTLFYLHPDYWPTLLASM
mgnify:CR=1 FL=1